MHSGVSTSHSWCPVQHVNEKSIQTRTQGHLSPKFTSTETTTWVHLCVMLRLCWLYIVYAMWASLFQSVQCRQILITIQLQVARNSGGSCVSMPLGDTKPTSKIIQAIAGMYSQNIFSSDPLPYPYGASLAIRCHIEEAEHPALCPVHSKDWTCLIMERLSHFIALCMGASVEFSTTWKVQRSMCLVMAGKVYKKWNSGTHNLFLEQNAGLSTSN